MKWTATSFTAPFNDTLYVCTSSSLGPFHTYHTMEMLQTVKCFRKQNNTQVKHIQLWRLPNTTTGLFSKECFPFFVDNFINWAWLNILLLFFLPKNYSPFCLFLDLNLSKVHWKTKIQDSLSTSWVKRAGLEVWPQSNCTGIIYNNNKWSFL